jgi:hypothetical protein
VSKDTLDIKELLNKVGWIAFLAGKTSPDDENKDNYYKQSEISIKRAEQALNLYIEERVAEAYKEGYAKSGIDMYQSMERAKVEVERQIRED